MNQKTTKAEHLQSKGILEAIYRPAVMPEHVGNLLIEALPPFRCANEMIKVFGKYPTILNKERSQDASYRILAVSRLNNYLEPLTAHFDVIEQVGHIVRVGYGYRNPVLTDMQKTRTEFYRQAMDGKIRQIEYSSPSTAPSFALFGLSGVGKSTVVEHALSYLPQVLYHEKYKFVQVVWMKIDCPPDGSLKQLLVAILDRFDNLLGTKHRAELGNKPQIDTLILSVANISLMYNLGILVIDETQHLLDASGVGQSKMLNFFLTFANVVKIPLVTVGTPRAMDLLVSSFRTARRVGDHGTFLWDKLSFGEEWAFFIENLWKFQWTSQVTPLTDDLCNLLYEKTQGIHALVVRLFQFAQLQAIKDADRDGGRSEVLTRELITQVADERFKLVQPMLNWLKAPKDGMYKRGSKEEKHFEDMFIKGLKRVKADVENEVNIEVLKAQKKNNRVVAERMSTVSALVAMGFDEGGAADAVDSVFDAEPEMTSRKALQKILSIMENNNVNDGMSELKSLRSIIEKGAESGKSPDAALKAEGIII
jgi:hypothetical protein